MQFDPVFIERILQHDDLAFAQFYEQTADMFFRYVVSHYSLSDAEAYDIVADVYVKIWENLDKYDEKYQFWQYVRTILKNHCKDYFKKMKPLFFSEMQSDDISVWIEESLIDANWDGEPQDIRDLFQQEFQYEKLIDAISHMDQESQELMHARFVLWYDYDTIALLYTSTNQAMRQKISRICHKLRQQLTHLK